MNQSQNSLPELEKGFFQELRHEGKSVNTLKNYKTDLDCFHSYLNEEMGHSNLGKFGLPEVVAYGQYLERRYTSDNSRRRRVQTLRLFFDYLVRTGLFPTNPVRKIPTSPKVLDVPHPNLEREALALWSLTLEETSTRKLLNKTIAYRNALLIGLVYFAGLRVSDLANLKIPQLFIPVKEGDELRVLLTPRKRDPYSIRLPNIMADIAKEYLNLQERLDDPLWRDSEGLAFFSANAHALLRSGLTPRGIELIFADYSKKIGIKFTPKSLRQSAIIRWLYLELPDSQIKEWLGVAPSYSLGPYKSVKEKYWFSGHQLIDRFREMIQPH